VQFDREWLDFGTAKSHEIRIEFLAEAWEAAAATGTVASGGSLQQGDVLYFYTQRIHRAPPPPPPGSPRYMLYCSLAPSARRGAPRTRRCWQARGGRGGARLHFKYLLSEYEVGVSGCDMPLETQRVCAHFLLKMASSDPQIPKKSAARPYKGGEPPPTPTQIATLTATIMHAWFGPPVDVQGTLQGADVTSLFGISCQLGVDRCAHLH
jgi:hypothetical protein